MKKASPFLLPGLFLLTAAVFAADPSADPYYRQLQQEFRDVGPARFVGGDREEDVLTRLSGRDRSGTVQGQPFSRCKTLDITVRPKIFWSTTRKLVSDVPVRRGESILVVFWARGKKAPQYVDDGAGAVIQPYLHSEIGDFPKGRVTNFYDAKELTETWQRYFIKSGPLPMDFPAGKLSLVLMLGHKVQTIDLGGLAWMVFPAGARTDKMPRRSWTYDGRAADAPWRAEAEKRIDRYRKGELTVEAVDSRGRPVPGATVRIRMKQHAFRFGTAVAVPAFTGKQKGMSAADVGKYREISSSYFNAVAIENALKWHLFESGRQRTGAFSWDDIVACVKFYRNQGKAVRGHVLVWPSFFRTPAHLQTALKADPKRLERTVREHIVEEMTLVRDGITDWDVTNETHGNRDYMDVLGPQSLVSWYRLAREVDPRVKLTFNEPRFGADGMEIGSFPEKLLSDRCRGWADYLIRQGAPFDYLGSQCHGGCVGRNYGGKTGPEGLWKYFDYLVARYGKRLQYTELDLNINDDTDPEQLSYQADKLRDTMMIAFAHPAFDAITQWGFWAGRHWAPRAALWSKDWQLRPHGRAYLDLVYKTWWTDADLRTGPDGRCAVRGFCGDYEITVNGQTAPRQSLTTAGKTVKVVLKQTSP